MPITIISPKRATPVRFGIVGGGWLGIDIGNQVRDHKRALVTAIADVSESALTDASGKLDIPISGLFIDHKRLFAEISINVTVITTPHAFHYEQLVDGLKTDLYVLCEKPSCIDTERARDLVECIEIDDRQVMMGYQLTCGNRSGSPANTSRPSMRPLRSMRRSLNHISRTTVEPGAQIPT